MKLLLHEYRLPLAHPFTIARESITEQHSLIVELREGGHSGFGEAPLNDYYDATLNRVRAALESAREAVESHAFTHPHLLFEATAPWLAAHPFAQSALDCAAHDLWGRQQNQSVHRLWGLDPAAAPASSYTIGIDTVEVMVAKLLERPHWPVYKVKVGTANDLEAVRALRAQTTARLRVDANCGWSEEEAVSLSLALAGLGVEFIEQPLPPNSTAQERVFAESALPLIADESCVGEADVEACAGRFHGINIKLCKCGGLTPARRMVAKARALGLRVMVGCMTESTVGISAAAQMAPLVDFVDLDGAALLAADAATGVRVEDGRFHFPDAPGCGIELLPH